MCEMIENGGIPGELDHPVDREEIDSSRIAILMKEKPKKKDGKLWAKFSILNTPLGKIAYTLAKAGFKLGVSSRGSGDVNTNYDGPEEVDESSYNFKCFDLVVLPSVKSARLNLRFCLSSCAGMCSYIDVSISLLPSSYLVKSLL